VDEIAKCHVRSGAVGGRLEVKIIKVTRKTTVCRRVPSYAC